MKLFLVLLVTVMAMTSTAWAGDEFDFRKTRWGMSKEEVKRSETEKLVEDSKDTLIYLTTLLNGKKVALFYFFAGNKLVRTKYGLQEKYTNKNDYYYLFFLPLQESLIKKYGEPNEAKRLWRNELYIKDPSQFGFAISAGHCIEFNQWENKRTMILQLISGNNFEVVVGVEYYSVELRGLENNKLDAEDADKL
ncbi:hypothetical protein [Megalodesulfovibrio paquesii]